MSERPPSGGLFVLRFIGVALRGLANDSNNVAWGSGRDSANEPEGRLEQASPSLLLRTRSTFQARQIKSHDLLSDRHLQPLKLLLGLGEILQR